MDFGRAIQIAETLAGPRPQEIASFYKYTKDVWSLAKEAKDKTFLTKQWALAWKKISDSADKIIAADPLLLYVPANRMSRELHASLAFARMSCSANRCSKTSTLLVEGAGTVTGRDWGRKKLPPPANIFHIGVDFQKYAPNVFESKLLVGEPDCPFTPIFPENGKWFYHYDEKKKRLLVACPSCAEKNRGQSCTHKKSSWTLFSDNEGSKVLQGGTYRVGIYDEEVGEEFWTEGLQRTQTVPDSFILVGFTPLAGPDHWPHRRIADVANGPKELNRVDPSNPESQVFASYHTISQAEGGLVPLDKIAASRATMDEAEAAARLDGEPVPIVANPVFPRAVIAEMRRASYPPEYRGDLRLVGTDGRVQIPDSVEDFGKLSPESKFEIVPNIDSSLKVWQKPIKGYYYIAAVDCAIGLAKGDPVCTSVIRVTPGLKAIKLALVAQYHGWLNSFDYAAEVIKIAIWYNGALVAIENTGGYGEATTLKLREWGYWNLYVDEGDRTSTDPYLEKRIGVNTNVVSKPFMVSATQRFVMERNFDIPCDETLKEMMAFEQQRTKFGGTTRYRGASGTHDDRVMSLVIGCGVAVSYPLYRYETLLSIAEHEKSAELSNQWRDILAAESGEEQEVWYE